MTDYVGQQFGQYQLSRLLGRGSFGEVYLGEYVYHHTPAAVKVLQARLTAKDLREFINEANTTFRLQHPHIVRLLEFGIDPADIPFLVMAYAPNGTLRQQHPKGTCLPLESIIAYASPIAAALQHAHDQRLIHRDVKPENILLGPNNEIWLSDFGITSVAHSTHSLDTEKPGGTVPYMAPEQLQGKARPASDQYALGVIVYEWLCGERPFSGTATEIAMQHFLAPPPSLHEKMPTISRDVEHVVMTALTKDPAARWASVQAFATALEQASQAEQGQIAALPHPPSQPLPPSPPVLPQQHLHPSVVEPVIVSLAPTLPTSQDLPMTQSAPAASPKQPQATLLRSSLESQPLQSSPRRISRRGVMIGLGALAGVSILGSIAWQIHSQKLQISPTAATSTAVAQSTAATDATMYARAVAMNGMMFGFNAQHTHGNPYERTLTPATVPHLKKKWAYQADYSLGNSSPAVADGVVYIGSRNGKLYAIDAASGSQKWVYQTNGPITSSPAVADGVVYIGSWDFSLYAIDATSGTKKWSYQVYDKDSFLGQPFAPQLLLKL